MPINIQEEKTPSGPSLALDATSPKGGLNTKAPLGELPKAEGVMTVRKLSKRKDKEADVQFFLDQGYMPEVVIAYVTRLANPSFDDWMIMKIKAGEIINVNEFKFNIEELARGGRGPLIDMNKLDNISSEYFSYIDNVELYQMILSWSIVHYEEFYKILEKNRDYTIKVFGIERIKRVKNENGEDIIVRPDKIRKDIYKLSQIYGQYYYFFDELYNEKKNSLQYEVGYPFSAGIAKQLKEILESPESNIKLKINNPLTTTTTIDNWLADMKSISVYLGYDKFANFMRDLRLALTLEERTPNLYDIMQVMGKERVLGRLG